MKTNGKFLLSLLVLIILYACTPTSHQFVPDKPGTPIENATLEKIKKSIVLIKSETGSGTGFFVAPDKIATNSHVVAHAGPIFVKSPDKEKDWRIEGVIGYDAENSLVILKIDGEGTPLNLDNSDTAQIGEAVYIPGFPDGDYEVTETSIQTIRKSSKWHRLNTTTSKETNGGPVLNNKGQVIAVIVPYKNRSYGYAIPSGALEALFDKSMPIQPLSEWQQRKHVRAEVYYGLGKEKLDAEDYKGAIADFDKAIELNPKYIRAYYERGRTQAHLADYASGIASCTRVIEMDPNEADAYYVRGSLKIYLGDYANAIVDLNKAIEIDPEHVDAYSNRGAIKLSFGESENLRGNTKKGQRLYEAAVTDCDKAIEIDPEHANAYIFRGVAKLVVDNLEGAVLDFERFNLLNSPKDVDAETVDLESENLGDSTVRLISWRDGFSGGTGFYVDRDKIVTNLHVVAEPGPVFAMHDRKRQVWSVEGITAFDVKNDLVILKVAGESVPLPLGNSETVQKGDAVTVIGYPGGIYNVATGEIHDVRVGDRRLKMNVKIARGNSGSPVINSSGEVIGIASSIIDPYSYASPSNALRVLLARSETVESLEQWHKRDQNRAYAKFVIGQYKDAIANFDKAIQFNPEDADAYSYRGAAKLKLKDFEGALFDCNRAIQLNPEDADAYSNRGQAQFHLGAAKFRRGQAKKAQELYEAAIEDYTQAIKLNPEDAKFYSGFRGAVKSALTAMLRQ